MGGRLLSVRVAGLLFACVVSACGDDRGAHPTGMSHGKGGRAGSSHGGEGGSAGAAGIAGTGGAGGRGSPTALPPPAANITPGSFCEEDGWCWYNPLPSGTRWLAVAGAGRTDLWIAGVSRNVLHFDGGRWTIVPSPLSSITGAWAASETDVWFVGIVGDMTPGQTWFSAIAHWDGVAITVVAELGDDMVNDVWGANARDVYAVAGQRTWHWDGVAWTALAGVPGGMRVAGSGSNDVWIALVEGLAHFDGTGWARVAALESRTVNALAVIAPDDVWVAVDDVFVQHFDGVAWSTDMQLAVQGHELLHGMGAAASDDIWLVGATHNGFDEYGYLNHYDGRSWQPGPFALGGLSAVRHVAGIGDIAVGPFGKIQQLRSTPALGFTDLRTGPALTLSGVFGSAPTDMWAVGDAGTVLHFDGRAVSSVVVPTSANLLDVWGSGPNDVWLVGTGGTVLHFDGQAFTPIASGTTVDLKAVFTARPNDVWIGGDAGTLLHWDGATLSTVPLTGVVGAASILDIHGIGADDVWLSGEAITSPGGYAMLQPFVAHFDGMSWSPADLLDTSEFGGTASPKRIWALAANDVWIATDQRHQYFASVYRHFDGTAWSFVQAGDGEGQTFMFPRGASPSFVFGPHDRWLVDLWGTWMRNTR